MTHSCWTLVRSSGPSAVCCCSIFGTESQGHSHEHTEAHMKISGGRSRWARSVNETGQRTHASVRLAQRKLGAATVQTASLEPFNGFVQGEREFRLVDH